MNREGIRRLAAETLGLPTSPYRFVDTLEEYHQAIALVGLPCVVKPVMSSSGKGQSTVRSVDQVEAVAGQLGLAGFHRAAGDEHHRDVQAQRGHQHAGSDLVAVADADDGVGAMRIDHVLHGVGDDLAARQRIEHAVVAHGDAVVDGDGVELLGYAAGCAHLLGDDFSDVA